MTETPVETARRVWPGEWTEHNGNLIRTLYALPGADATFRIVFEPMSVGRNHWRASLCMPHPIFLLASDALADALSIARWNAQSIIKGMAQAVDLQVTR